MYLRKSSESDDRQALSIPAQERELNTIVRQLGLELAAEPFRESMSAKAPGRPLFEKMIGRLRKGAADGIVCWHLDRLARNPADGGQLMWLLGRGAVSQIVTPGRTYTGTGDDKLMMSIIFGMATKYSDDLSVNVKRGNKAALERGRWPTAPKIGYVRDRKTNELAPDPVRFGLCRKMWRMRLDGVPVSDILQTARDEWHLLTPSRKIVGGKLLSASQLYRFFHDPFYTGIMVHGGGSFKGNHQPMVTWHEFQRVQDEFDRATTTTPPSRPKTHWFAYRGLITCGACGALVTARYTTNRHGTRYIHYHCCRKRRGYSFCPQRSIEESQIEAQLLAYLRSLVIPSRLMRWLHDRCKYLVAELDTEREAADARFASLIAANQRRQTHLLDLHLDNVISREDFSARNDELVRERIDLEQRREANRESPEIEPLTEAISFANLAASAFENGDKQKRREITTAVVLNLALKDKTLLIQPAKLFAVLGKMSSSSTWLNDWEHVRSDLVAYLTGNKWNHRPIVAKVPSPVAKSRSLARVR